VGYIDLESFYKLHFSVIANSGTTLTLTEIHDMIPFERDIMVDMIRDRNERIKREQEAKNQ